MNLKPSFRYELLLVFFLLPAIVLYSDDDPVLEKSAYFAYVDLEYIFTIEVVKPGTPILNFVILTDRDEKLQAKNIRLLLGNRQAAATLFYIEIDRYQQPLITASIQMHPRSSFGVRLQGKFGKDKELYGAEIKVLNKTFSLAPLSRFDFETLVRKVNRMNLESPDFRDDFRVLNLEPIGYRSTQDK